ncbi:MAG: flagellar biosynthesis protein FlhB [Campylobacterota bacterium]|nr:flagellar biosynthesis protein FlhB [Campylobacterota bacterium]
MADDAEKTEEPTSKKIEDARKEGNVPKSMDFSGFIGLLVALLAFLGLSPYMLEGLKENFIYTTSFIAQPLNTQMIFAIIITVIKDIVMIVLPFSIAVLIAGVAGNVAQIGFLFTTKPLTPDLNKIDPIKGLKNIFSMKKLVEGIKITAKVSIAMVVGTFVFLIYIKELPKVERFDFFYQMDWLLDKSISIAAIMLIVFFIFGVIDVFIVRYQYFKQLRMSKNELKDEFKNTEGNPEVKARIRRLQHQMARNRMMADVPKADVVIRNPTHFAVALRFNKDEGDNAPVVLAKGADNIALKIIEIAREHKVQIYENKALAQELYKKVDIGKEIPLELYQAVAEVLAYVYRINNKKV